MKQKNKRGFVLLLALVSLGFASSSYGAGYLPRDKSREVIQGVAPDVFTSKVIGESGTNTLTVTNDTAVRFKCNYPITYHFGTGTAWPVTQNTEEFVLVPLGKTTLNLFSTVNPTTCNIQESRQ